jgi:hypothetical protein
MDYKTSNLNSPLSELDTQITINVAAITALQAKVEALEAEVFRMSPSVSPSPSPSASESPSESPSVSPS